MRSDGPFDDNEIIASPVTVRLSDVIPRSVEWLWPERIAIGKLTLIAGDPGLGKSFVTLDIAARVSTGRPWPDRREEANTPGDVILLSAEDGVEDTIRPRLDAAGADVSRITALQAVAHYNPDSDETSERAFNLEVDPPALELAIRKATDCRLVIVDPITAYCGKTDSHVNTAVRGLLAPLATLAAKYRVAVLAVSHLNKSGGGAAIYRVMGSLAFTAAVRGAWQVTKDADDPSRRLLLPTKNNLAPDSTAGLAFTLTAPESGGHPVVVWEAEPVTMTADEALAALVRRTDDRGKGRVEASADWLREQLASGPVPSRELELRAKDAGVSWASVRRAQTRLKIVPSKTGFDGPWCWALPEAAQDRPSQPDEHLEQVERLGDFSGEFIEGAQDAQGAQDGEGDDSEHLGSDSDDDPGFDENLRDLG